MLPAFSVSIFSIAASGSEERGLPPIAHLLGSAPELVNKDPYGEGWIIKVSLSKPEELDTLLSPAQYREMIGA